MSVHRPSRFSQFLSFLRRPAVVGGGTLLVVLVIVLWWKVGNFYPVKGFLKQWREDKFMILAQEQVAQKKYPEAARILQNILQANPNSLEAWKLRLKVSEGEDNLRGTAQSLNQLIRLQPANLENRIRLAKILLDARDAKGASSLLADIPAAQAGRPEVLRLTGEIAMSAADLPLAERKFRELLKANPEDKSARFNLASIALNRTDLITLNEARDSLRAFLADPEFHLAALRLLLTTAIRVNNQTEVRELTHRLAAEPNLTFPDRILLLSGQRLAEKPAYERSLEELKKEAETESEKATQLAQYFMRNRMFTEAEKFLSTLPDDLAAKPEFAYLMSQALFATRDWKTLEQKLRAANWERFDYMRLAFLAYTIRAQGAADPLNTREKEFDETWNLALIGADPVPGNTRNLLAQAGRWGWRNEVTNLLWKLFQRDSADEETYRQLIDITVKAGNTASVQRVFARRLETKPDDTEAKNNSAYLSMLLGTGLNQAYRNAREAYDKEPKNAFYLTSQAIALLKQRQPADALKLIEQLSPEQRVLGSRAVHYAAILLANGKAAEARKALGSSAPASSLPEEKALFDHTKQAIDEVLGAAK